MPFATPLRKQGQVVMNKLEMESLENLQVSLQQNPDSLTFARVADALMKNGRLDEAIRICEEGIRRHPYYVTGHMVLGKCYMQKKYYDQAEKEFKRVLLFDPKYIAAHRYYGDLMREIGWDNTCEMSYRKILHIDPLDRNVQGIVEEFTRKAAKDEAGIAGAEQEPAGAKSAKPKSSRDSQILPPKKSPRPAPPAPEPVIVNPPRPEPINGDLEIPVVKPPVSAPSASQTPPLNKHDEARFSSILDDIFQDEMMSEASGSVATYQRGKSEETPPPEPKREVAPRQEDGWKRAAKQEKAKAEARNAGSSFEEQAEARATTNAITPSKRRAVELDLELDELAANADRVWAPSTRPPSESFSPMPEKPAVSSKTAETEGLSIAGLRDAGARDKIVTPTLGEIYAAQGQYAKAIGVFELLSKKDPANRNYREKIDYLKKRLQETQNAE